MTDHRGGPPRSIVLFGLLGVGKSSTARRLKQLVEREHIDTDDEVERRTGATVAELFVQAGEEGFRRLEAAVIADVAQADDLVISVGGGAVLPPVNVELLRRRGLLLRLVAPLDVITERALRRVERRPLLAGDDARAKLAAIAAAREAAYTSAADATIDTARGRVHTMAAIVETLVRRDDVLTPDERARVTV